MLLTSGSLFAQHVTIKMKRPPLNQLNTADLWSATIINSGESFTAYLYGSLTNNENGELIATGQTVTFEVKRGTTNFKVSDLPSVPDINYLSKDPKYKQSFMNTGGAPPGEYRICVEMRFTDNRVAGEDCFDQKIMGGDAPQLISPRNDEELNNDNPIFTWMHFKAGSDQTYTLRIVELKGNESPENAMLKNKAFFEKEGISQQLLQYPSSASQFEDGKVYVWGVRVNDKWSEFSIFKPRPRKPSLTIELISPANGTNVESDSLTFRWRGQPPPKNGYTLRIVELKGNESPENAMLKNKAFFEKEEISGEMFFWPLGYSYKSTPEKRYAWQVKTGNVESEVYTFVKSGTTNPPTTQSMQPFCTDFEDGGFGGWQADNIDIAIIATGGNPGKYIETTDKANASFFFNTDPSYIGNWGELMQDSCASLCFDISYLYRGNVYNGQTPPATMSPNIRIEGNGFTAVFVAWNLISEGDGWHSYCAPLKFVSPNGALPSNTDGRWLMASSNTGADWNSLLTNVTKVKLTADVQSYQQERIGYDNICIKNSGDCVPYVCDTCGTSQTGNICDTFKVAAVSVATPIAGDCCWSLDLTHPANTTGITGIQFLSVSPNTFVTGSSQLASSTGWLFPVNNGQEFTIKKLGGTIPSGQQNAFVKFCLNKLSSPQQVIVNWLKADNSIVCSDTVTMNCDIPCVTFSNDTLLCSGNNYDLQYSFTNNASYPINKIEVSSVTPSNVTVTPSPLTLTTPVSPGGTANVPPFTVTGAVPGSTVCIKFKFSSPDGCCWCYDSLCVEIPSCVCNEVGATVTGDPLNCCYSLNLQNNFSGTHFTQVTLRTLEAGVTFSTWYTNTANNYYSTNNYPDNQIHLINDPANFPNSYIPLGNSANVLNFCLQGYTSTTQNVLVQWMRGDSVVCIDTITVNCIPPPPVTPCVQLINDSLTCLPDGTFLYTFNVKNNSTHTTTGFQFNPVTPGLVFTPANFSTVTIAPGMISTQQSMVISGVAPGSQFCFNISLYEHVLITGQQYYDWCCYSDEICKTAPVCPTSNNCEFEVRIKSAVCKQNAAGQWYYDIAASVNNLSGSTATLNSILVDNGTMNCTPVTLNTGMNNLNCSYTLTGTLVNPVCFTFRILTPGSIDTCKFRVCRELPPCSQPDGCNCNNGKWDQENGVVRFSTGGVSTDKPIYCNSSYTIDANTAISLWPKYFCSVQNCAAKFTYRVNGGAMTGFQSSPYNISNIVSTTDVMMYAWCGDKICDSCRITINVKNNDCDCGEWKSKKIKVSINDGKETGLVCGEKLTVDLNSLVILNFPSYICRPENCPAAYSWDLTSSSGVVISGTDNPFKHEFTTPGTYTLSYKAYCGGKLCDSCVVTIVVIGKDKDCNCGKWGDERRGFTIHGFNGNPNSEIEEFVGCERTYSSIYQNVVLDLTAQQYLCDGKEDCRALYEWIIKSPSGVTTSFSSMTINDFTFSEIGTYSVTLRVSCNGVVCDKCTSFIKVIKKGDIK